MSFQWHGDDVASFDKVADLFINKEWAERVHAVDPEDVAESQMSSWFRRLA